jgi:hypothetical protein
MKASSVFAATACLGLLAAAWPAQAQDPDTAQAQTVVTVMGKDSQVPPPVQQNAFKVQVNGKSASVTGLTALRGDRAGLELVILIDGSARESLGRQMSDIASFVKSLPPTTAIGIAYMENGRAVFAQPLSADKAQALQSLHLPGGSAGSNASPYFCLSDLAKNWPSSDRENRREVVMITDGVDPYNARYDPDDPYVQSAINDSIRAGLIVHAIYWRDEGRFSRTSYATNDGQSLLSEVTQATGGRPYFQGLSNPVSFDPFFSDLQKRLNNQYELGFTAPTRSKSQVDSLKVKLDQPDTKLDAPQRVAINPGGLAEK